MADIQLTTLTCKRCTHKWIPRKPVLPKWCPKCLSPYWNKERRTTPATQMTHATHEVTPEMKIAQMQKEIESLKKQLAQAKRKDGGKSNESSAIHKS